MDHVAADARSSTIARANGRAEPLCFSRRRSGHLY
jgi:hypothetical protein